MRFLLAALLILAPVVAAQDDLASLLPADTMLLIEGDDLGGADGWAKESALGKAWAEPEVRAFFDKLYANLKAGMAKGPNPLAMVGLTIEDFEGVSLERGGLAVVDFRMKEGQPVLDAVMLFEARTGADKMSKIATAARKGLEAMLGEFQSAKMRGRTVQRKVLADWVTIYVVEDGARVIVTTQAARMEQILAALDGTPVPALKDAPRFKEIFAKMDAGRRALTGYMDVRGMLARAKDIMPSLIGEGDWKEAEEAIAKHGFDAVDAFAMADIPAGRFLRTEFAVTLKERRGMFDPGDTTPPTGAFLKRLPKNSWVCSHARLDAARTLGNMLIDPDAAAGFAEMEAEFKKHTGLDLFKDLLAPMGTEWGFFIAPPPAGGLIPDIVMFNSVKDKDKLQASMAQLAERVGQMAGVAVKVKTTEFRGTTIHFMEIGQLRGDPIPVSPSWAFGEDFVVLAAAPQSLKHALMARPSIAENADFNALRRHVPGTPVSLGYIDVGGFLAWLYNTATPVLQVMQGAINEELAPYGVVLNFEDLPPATVWSKHLGGLVSYSLVEDGIMRSGYVSPYGSGIIAVPFTAGVAVGMGAVFLMVGGAAEPIEMEEVEEAEEVEEEEIK